MSYVELGLGTGVAPLLEHDTIKSIASKLNKGPAQILLRWSTQKGIAVIPKSNNQKRLANNLDVCSFDIPEEDVKKVDALDQRLRFNDPTTVSQARAVAAIKGDDATERLPCLPLPPSSTASRISSSSTRWR
jgi:D-xylose reductase